MTIGESIKKYRKEMGLTQQQLADCLCVSLELVSKWECGDRRPDYATVTKLSEILMVPATTLVNYENEILRVFVNLFPEVVERDQMISIVNSFLNELCERDRDMFVMRYNMFLDTKAIADKLGLKDSNVRKRLSRLRKNLCIYYRRLQNEN